MDDSSLLLCLVQVIGRVAIPVNEAREIVGTGNNRLKAFNMCDGIRTISEIAKATKINQGNLSRAAAIWVQQGIAFRIGEKSDARFLHIYPIPLKISRRKKGGKK